MIRFLLVASFAVIASLGFARQLRGVDPDSAREHYDAFLSEFRSARTLDFDASVVVTRYRAGATTLAWGSKRTAATLPTSPIDVEQHRRRRIESEVDSEEERMRGAFHERQGFERRDMAARTLPPGRGGVAAAGSTRLNCGRALWDQSFPGGVTCQSQPSLPV